jgi:DNA invertase Pin-like site-specific DNA recombinase
LLVAGALNYVSGRFGLTIGRKKMPQPQLATAIERYSNVHRLLKSARVPVSVARIAEEFECSEQVVYRLIEEMREHLRALIERKAEWSRAGLAPPFNE